jgi:5-methyltetrahydrofolate--homocysteine methyltransferase
MSNTTQPIMDHIRSRVTFFDGGTGSVLQELGLAPGALPECWNIDHPEEIISLHQSYFEAGCNIIKTNTFGANILKFPDTDGAYTLEAVVTAAIANAKEARRRVEAGEPLMGPLADALSHADPLSGTPAGKRAHYIALDIGPTGKLLKPLGDLDFEDAVGVFAKTIEIGARQGVDLILIETMNDSHEAKAALLAAKEHSQLPVFVTTVYDEGAKLLTGANPAAMTAILEGLRADALGMNCSLGPEQMLGIVPELVKYASAPVVVNPNAGLPRSENGKTVYDVHPAEFARLVSQIVDLGAHVVGGCCGTTPAHIRALVNAAQDKPQHEIADKGLSLIASYTHAVELGKQPILIGERINPTGKKRFKQALREHDMDYIIGEGLKQQANGAHALDVNVGLPEIDEPALMVDVVKELQAVLDLPLQIDTTDLSAMEQALRIYNGKALVNSVNGKQEVMHSVFPLVQKYGGIVVALTLDEGGIPETAEGRIRIAEKIYETAAAYGIAKKDIIIDPLAMAVSSDDQAALATLQTLKAIHDDFHGNTILGVSNISFGLPQREIITSIFFTMAMQNGLSAAIMNPAAAEMMKAYTCFCTLSGYDAQCMHYIDYASNLVPVQTNQASAAPTPASGGTDLLRFEGAADELAFAIQKGLKSQAEDATKKLLENTDALSIINSYLIPALDVVGKGFEAKTVYLPQLLMSADAAKSAFGVIKDFLSASGMAGEKKGTIILATVKGDIHDIGKNIVKVLLENYSFDVIDLGKDVPPETISKVCVEQHVELVGLSALMTTTVPSMAETIELLRKEAPWCKVCVGGAVLTQEYADMIGADRYCKDAMETVAYAQEIFNCK